MGVRDAFNLEYGSFLEAEEAHRQTTADAYRNLSEEGFQWYEQGPAKEHQFSRGELDREVSRTLLGPERMAKNAADHIAKAERAFRIRKETRLQLLLRAAIRQEQIVSAAKKSKELLEEEMG